MTDKSSKGSWYFFETWNSICALMLVYAFIMLMGLVSEATSTYVAAKNTDYHRRPYVWIMGGTYATLRGLTFIVIGAWAAAAYMENVRGMRIGFSIIFVRVVGNLLHGVGSFVWNTFLVKDTLSRRYRQIIHQELISRDLSLIFLLVWTIVECVMLDRMNHYELLCGGAGGPAGPRESAQIMSPPLGAPSRQLSPVFSPPHAEKASRPGSPSVAWKPSSARPSRAPSRAVSPTVLSPSSGAMGSIRAPTLQAGSPTVLPPPPSGGRHLSRAPSRPLSPTLLSPPSGARRPTRAASVAGSPTIGILSPGRRKIASP